MVYISNAFSLSMLSRSDQIDPEKARMPRPISLARAKEVAENADVLMSAIGHADTAAMVSAELGLTLDINRISIMLRDGDVLIVAQYVGPRLPEGTKTLPDGARFEYWVV